MVYFKMQDLVGSHNCIESYNEYLRLADWLNTNILVENWHFDYHSALTICGYSIPQGIKFYNFLDAIYFIKSIA